MQLSFTTALVFAACVSIVGLPHGGLDHLFGRSAFKPILGPWWLPAFAGFYLGLAALVLAGWLAAPMLTIVLFFLISAYHFGDADGRKGAMAIVVGGTIIWVPILARPDDVSTILSLLIPDGQVEIVSVALARVRPLIWALLALFVCDLLLLSIHGKKWVAARCAVFAVAFALLPVLVSFCCFFCGWHSVRELAGLAKRANPTNPLQGFVRVVRLAIPMAALAAIATVALAWWFAAERDPTSVVVRGVFLGLSALAVPHILLHEAADRLGAEPFSRNNHAWRTVAIT